MHNSISESIYLKPNSLQEAIKMAYENESEFRYLSGGTDVLVNKFQGNDTHTCLIDITGITELKEIMSNGKHLCIGALTPLDDLKNNDVIKKEFPVLLEAAKSVATPIIRKTATLGGNLLCENRCTYYNQSDWWREAVGYCLKCDGDICIATGGKKQCFSKFVSDTAIALISMGAYIEIVEKKGGYISRLEDLYTGNGVNPFKIDKTSIIKSIDLPLNESYKSVFKKLRQRQTLEFSSLSTAVTINKNGKIKIVLGAVDPKPIVVEGTIGDNKDELIKLAVKKARIIDNDVFPRLYRKEMITVYLNQSFNELGY